MGIVGDFEARDIKNRQFNLSIRFRMRARNFLHFNNQPLHPFASITFILDPLHRARRFSNENPAFPFPDRD